MRKLMFIILAATLTVGANAQSRNKKSVKVGSSRTVSKKTQVASPSTDRQYYVGGSFGLGSTSYDGSSVGSSFTFLPEGGYVVNDKIAIGLKLGYSSTTDKTGQVDLDRTSFSIRPYLRYTLLNEGHFSLFVDGSIGYTTSNNQTANGNKAVDNKVNSYGIYVEPGFAYSLSDSFSLVAHIGDLYYTSSKPDVSGAKATTRIGLALTNSVSFGIYYHF